MNTQRIFKDERQMKAVLGMGKAEFQALIPSFTQAWYLELRLLRPERIRKIGGGKKGALKTMEDKLFAILLYLKTYPTFDVLGLLTDRERTRACRSTHFLLKVLERALGKHLVLPQRKITSVKEFFEKFPQAKDVFLDGTERPIQKPRNQKKRRRLYSGKKKQTTRKSLLMTDEKKHILLLSPAKSGRRHDKRLADKLDLPRRIPPQVAVWTDTGFQGMQKDHPNTIMPEKATKNHPLTYSQKQNNRIVSGIRMLVEHAIGGMKRMKASSDIYRNRIANTDDRMNLLAAGLWNFHLQQTA